MARVLNGTSSIINVGSSSVLNPTEISCALWAYFPSIAGAFCIAVSRDDNSLGRSYDFGYSSSGTMAMQLNGSEVDGTATLSSGQWYSLGYSFSSANSAYAFYINGAVDKSGSFTATLASTTGPTEIGQRSYNGSPGSIAMTAADVALWNVILTATEFAALAKGARPYQIRHPALVGYWPLDGLQTPEPDLSGNANNGTLTNASAAFGAPTRMFTPYWPLNTPAAAAGFTAKERRTLSPLGTRVGSRQARAA
jgi:hypothetical protein